MSNKKPTDASQPLIPGEDETANLKKQLLYTAIGYHASKRKLLYFVLPSIVLFAHTLLLSNFFLAGGMAKVEAVVVPAGLFVFYSWCAITDAWPLLGQSFLQEMEDLFGPRTRVSLWEQFYTKKVKQTGIDVFATAKAVNEYADSNWVKLNKATARK